MTFRLQDITEELFEKIAAYWYSRSSGLGGPGGITALTADGEEYFIGIEGFEHSEQDMINLFPALADRLFQVTKSPEEIEGWMYLYEGYGSHLLIRNEYFSDIMDRPNVTFILENHEQVALEGMEFLMKMQFKKASDLDELPEYIKDALTE